MPPSKPHRQAGDFNATRHPELRLVAEDHGNIVGWVAASPISSRTVYRGVVEHSIFIAQEACGRGLGNQLLDAFIQRSEANGMSTIQSNIFPENTASIALHAVPTAIKSVVRPGDTVRTIAGPSEEAQAIGASPRESGVRTTTGPPSMFHPCPALSVHRFSASGR
ncbi:N-acetyltransferase family protein [Arthrobacter sp. fls2-241-R2A-200]